MTQAIPLLLVSIAMTLVSVSQLILIRARRREQLEQKKRWRQLWQEAKEQSQLDIDDPVSSHDESGAQT